VIRFLEEPTEASIGDELTRLIVQHARAGNCLEFVFTCDGTRCAIFALLPVISSGIFPLVWLSIFLNRGADVQITVQTAFTVAGYIVTAGVFHIYFSH
jgi:hypothetical protein